MRTARAFLILSCLLTACVSERFTSGIAFTPERLSQLRIGESTSEDVARVLGYPSHIPPFTPRRWYYIHGTTEGQAFFLPEAVERKVLAFSFDEADKVKDIHIYDMDDSVPIVMAERITPSQGRTLTFMDQLFSSYARLPGTIESAGPGGPGGPP